MENKLPDSVRNLNDLQWLDMLLKSVKMPVVDGVEFPGFPSDETQTTFVGSANEKTLREAFAFYVFLKKACETAGNPIRNESRFLDFGCGWGRYLRFFWKDVKDGNLFGCDVNQGIVDTCLNLKVPGQIDRIDPLGRLPYPDHFFDAMMAYSVFTHLPEKVHMHWIMELARVANTGCIFSLTLEPRRFIDFVANIPSDTEMHWYKMLSAHKPHISEFYQAFDAGNLAFMPTNKGVEDTYGDAVVPLSFVQKNWSPYFEVLDYVDDSNRFWQAVLTVRRTKTEI